MVESAELAGNVFMAMDEATTSDGQAGAGVHLQQWKSRRDLFRKRWAFQGCAGKIQRKQALLFSASGRVRAICRGVVWMGRAKSLGANRAPG